MHCSVASSDRRDIESLRIALRRSEGLSCLRDDMAQALQLAQTDDVSLRQIHDKMKANQVFTARVLKMAGSPAFGGQQVTTLDRALAILGLTQTKKILLSVALRSMDTKTLCLYGFDHRQYIRRSLALSETCAMLAKKFDIPDANSYFVSGLLLEVGFLVENQFAGQLMQKVVATSGNLSEPLTTVERTYLGYDHAEVGGVLGEEWGFDLSIRNAIQYHHEPISADPAFLRHADLAHLATHVCDEIGIPLFHGCPAEKADPYSLQRLAIGEDLALSISERITEQTNAMEQALFAA